ncbi:restriction endonuclease [Bradyrhizobium sp. CCBAU 11430]|uniref:5-methylcytosine-specific restriction endonuclease system specificity protein McrC n=1 Tax=Bradyrhizobium sp. CCBAU 11430 TaxID=1630881 RepID=UPI00230698E9|nr:5-methylcytosine-specific restriction endonuclease system specificity protein McrC [Bradyrhizobium sp. CCBAU 11430]MDA9515916.1 restriction endonuclease [Bradyrhizobium sp. CCBAU 11430]
MSNQVWQSQKGIPIRNLWLLLVYASGLAEFESQCGVGTDDDVELADILGRLLVRLVKRRLRTNLSRGYQRREAVIPRVRGRVDWLQTVSRQHLQRGRLACRFEELSFDTPRNRLVRSALIAIAGRVRDHAVAADCRRLGDDLGRLGIVASRPTQQEMSADTIGSHQSEDRFMINAARLAFEMLLPNETPGDMKLSRLKRDEITLRKIFEKGVTGFYRHHLRAADGWTVREQNYQSWQLEPGRSGDVALLPGMKPDIILDRRQDRRIVIDTKFTSILAKGIADKDKLKSANIYQIYAYLLSQRGRGPLCDRAEGVLLYPALDHDVDETFTIQGHDIRFVTVDLALKPSEILDRLHSIAQDGD